MTNTVWVVHEPNGPFREEIRELPTPNVGEVLVKIVVCGLNPLDVKIRAAQAGHARQTLPAVLGLDMSGIVMEVGPGVHDFQTNDEVYGMVGGVGGLQGTLAEYILADARLLAHKPNSLSFRQAAALPLVTITAWEGLVDGARVTRGQTVLIHAGAGGIGHIAVQLARARGAHVFATVSAEKQHVVQQFGGTPIDYKATSVEDYIASATGGEGFDVVYDTVGGATLDASFLAAKRYTGHVVSALGWGTHSLAPLSFRGATYSGVFTLYPLLSGASRTHQGEILKQARTLFEAGAIRPLLNERTFSRAEISQAFASVDSAALGKVVIEL